MAVGLLSAGIGSVPAAQTWIDIGQGARLNESLYDEGLPRLYVDPGVGGAPRTSPRPSGSGFAIERRPPRPTSSRASWGRP